MKTLSKSVSCGLLLVVLFCLSTPGQETAFTYQGRLNDGPDPANGTYDFRFALYDHASLGTQQGNGSTNLATTVSNGLFAVTLDFGSQFPGAARWLELGVRTNGATAFTTLSSRQKLTAAPYAITASNLSGTLPAAQLSGAVPSGNLSGTYGNAVTLNNVGNTVRGTFTGNGAGVTNVNAALLGGLSSTAFWRTNGNTGANPTNGTFLGTADNFPLEFKVNGARALRSEPNSFSPNFISGYSGNGVSNGFYGASILGGGEVGHPNKVGASFGAIIGGSDNLVTGDHALAMGFGATASGKSAAAIGESTLASGDYSLALGLSSQAKHPGTFVWADSSSGVFSSTAENQFLIRALGGVGIGTASPTTALEVAGTVKANGFTGNGSGLTALNADSLTGVLADARLSANVALRTGGNSFTGNQTVLSGSLGIGTLAPATALHVYGTESRLRLESISPVAFTVTEYASDGRVWHTGVGGSAVANQLDKKYYIYDNTAAQPRLVIDTSGNVGMGVTVPAQKLHVNGNILATGTITGDGANLANVNAAKFGGLDVTAFWKLGGNNVENGQVLGSTNNLPLKLVAAGLPALRLIPGYLPSDDAPNVIGGSSSNYVGPNLLAVTIAGGGIGSNLITTPEGQTFFSIAPSNSVTGSFGTIGGGVANRVTAPGGVVAGGLNNQVGDYGTVSGGSFNSSEELGVVAGGLGNQAGTNAVVPGGHHNLASGYGSFAAGGRAQAFHDGSFVWAGAISQDDVTFSSTGTNQFLIRARGGVGIGTANPTAQLTINGNIRVDATAQGYGEGLAVNCPADMSGSGGYGGVIFHAAPRGGTLNAASVKWAVNYNYNPENGVGGGGLAFIQNNSGTRLFLSAGGNLGIGTTAPSQKLEVAGNILASGTITGSSDRNVKEHFTSVNPRAVLEKVSALPITEWNYKADAGSLRHIGPMAQDFYAAFNVGLDDKHISMVDADGVALAAIQGLNQKLSEDEAALKKKDAEIEELRQAVRELQKAVRHLADAAPNRLAADSN